MVDWESRVTAIFHLMISYVHVFPPYSEEVTMKADPLPCQTFSVRETAAENRDLRHRLK
jgi:hypothetical protein